MNNEMMFFLLFGTLCALAGHFAYRSHIVVTAFFESRRRRKIFPALENAHQELLCKGPHSYDRIKLVMAPLPVGEYLTCKDCGFISNEEGSFKLNGPALEVYHNELKRRKRAIEIDAELGRRKREKLEKLMNELIKIHIVRLDGDMHKNIPELQQFFRMTCMEVESVYASLKKDLDDLERG